MVGSRADVEGIKVGHAAQEFNANVTSATEE
jgi:hypothetical protein